MQVGPLVLSRPFPESISIAVLVAIGLLVAAFQVYLFFRIFRRMGYSGWWGLLTLISPINSFMVIYLAFSKWPVESDIEWYARNIPDAAKEEAAQRMLDEADRLRSEFRFEDAKPIYRAILRLYPNADAGSAADKALTEVRMDELQKP
jgi:hypothetical protein